MADLSVAAVPSDEFLVRPASARTVMRLKSWRKSPTDRAPLTVAGCTLPETVGSVTDGLPRVLCTGPGDWLVVYTRDAAATLRYLLGSELSAQSLVLVDLTDGLVVLEVSGSRVRDVLSSSCGLDFHPGRFEVGQCGRTRFAQIPVTIDCPQDFGTFILYVARSYSAWLTDWLLDAAAGTGG
jgi:heterotetrameric sarcosine oxidase gamma subunit